MSLTALTDFQAYTGLTYTATEEARIIYWLDRAERYLLRQAGRVWYDAAAPTGDASEDWKLATAMVAERLFLQETPEIKAALTGPYQSEKLGDYSYTLRDGAAQSTGRLDPDWRVDEILRTYRLLNATPFAAMTLAAPSRVAEPVYDADVDDTSTWSLEGGER